MIEIENLKESEKKEFSRIVNKLLSTCFILRKTEKDEYRFISQHKQSFQDYFEIAGYQLEENSEYGVFQLINYNGQNRKQFNLSESIVLLILRLIYDDKKRQISLVSDAVTTSSEIQDLYQQVRGGKNITKTELRNALATMRRFHLVNYGSLNYKGAFTVTEEETPIIILDSITMAVPIQDIREVYKKLKKYSENR